MSNAVATTTERRIKVGNGTHVHRANNDGNTNCGSQRRMGRRSGTAFLPDDTPVTCAKCGADAPAPVAPAAPVVAPTTCPEGHRMSKGVCYICL